MVNIIWKFCVVQILCSSLLLTTLFAVTPAEAQKLSNAASNQSNADAIEAINTVNQNTGVSKDALTSGDVRRVTTEQINQANAGAPTAQRVSAEAQRLLNIATANLEEKRENLAEAQSGLNRANIRQKEAELAAAQSRCPNYGGESGTCPEVVQASRELQMAKTPNYDWSLIAQAKSEFQAAERSYVAATHEAQYGAQSVAGAAAIIAAAKEIDASITDEFKKDAAGNTKADGILNLIKKSTSSSTLRNKYAELGSYRAQLQQDIVMLVIGQVTSRLNACTQSPDIQLAIGAGQAFIVGEVAEYAQAEYLKGKLEVALKDQSGASGPYEKQLDTFRTLRTEYREVLTSADVKQKLRTLSLTAFNNAAALAAAQAVEDETWAVACTNENTNMVSRGSNQGGDNIIMYLAMAAAAYAVPYCGGCAAAAIYMMMKGQSENDKSTCEAGGRATEQRMINRKLACDSLGTIDMFRPNVENPMITASKTIRDRCLADGDAVNGGAGSGCKGYSSNGAGPYSACDKASDAYKRNMVACPVSVLKAGQVATLETSGIASDEGREFVRKASESVSVTVDMRIASPRHRIIVWTAFAELATNAVDTNAAMIIAIRAQLAKIEAIIAGLEKETKGSQIGLAKHTETTVKNQAILTDTIKFKNSTACMTGTGKDCKPISGLKAISGFSNLPFSLQASTATVAAGLDTINNTQLLSSGNLASIANASKEQASIRKSYLKKTEQLRSLANASNSKLDLDKESKNLLSSVKKTVSSKTGGSDFGDQSKSLLGSSGTKETETAADSADKTNGNKFDSSGMAYGGLSGSKGSVFSGDKKNSSSGSGESTAQATEEAAVNSEDNSKLADAIAARDRANKDKYASKDGLTIFEKVTNAYIRNYDKVLTKKKDKDLSE